SGSSLARSGVPRWRRCAPRPALLASVATSTEGAANDPRRRHHRESGHRRASRVQEDLGGDERRVRPLRVLREALRLRRGRSPAPVPAGALPDHRRLGDVPNRRAGASYPPRRHHPRRGREVSPVLERGRGRSALRVRGPTGAAVRAADRDDVLARARREDEPEGNAQPLAARGHRLGSFRHGAAGVPAGVDAARRARAGGAARPAGGLWAYLRDGARPYRRRGAPGMTWRRRLRRRLLWAGVLLGLVAVLALVTTLRLC